MTPQQSIEQAAKAFIDTRVTNTPWHLEIAFKAGAEWVLQHPELFAAIPSDRVGQLEQALKEILDMGHSEDDIDSGQMIHDMVSIAANALKK